MKYAKSFFDLQLCFAQKVSALADITVAEAIFHYTNLYVRFGLGGVPDAAHPEWQAYLRGFAAAIDPKQWTYDFYLTRAHTMTGPPVVATEGCFAYAILADGRLRLHFHNTEASEQSPLTLDRVPQRQKELATLFHRANDQVGGDAVVIGASWLYHLEAYRRLFPPTYIASACVLTEMFQRMPLWGQFVDRHGEIRVAMRERFLARLAQQSTVDQLHDCFPFPVLMVQAPVRAFCSFYQVS